MLSQLTVVAVLSCLVGLNSQSVYAETTTKTLPTAPIDENLIPKERLADALKIVEKLIHQLPLVKQ